jgi:DNA-binding transcriptional ArsR family regulator/putative flippase GtrA
VLICLGASITGSPTTERPRIRLLAHADRRSASRTGSRGHPARVTDSKESRRDPRGVSLKRQIATFAAIGMVSTFAYAVLYTVLRAATAASVANLSALALTTVGNTAANRRITFGVHDRQSAARDHLGGFVGLGAALIVSTAAILALHRVAPNASRLVELGVLIGSNGLAALFRFVVFNRLITARLAVPAGNVRPLSPNYEGGDLRRSPNVARVLPRAHHVTTGGRMPCRWELGDTGVTSSERTTLLIGLYIDNGPYTPPMKTVDPDVQLLQAIADPVRLAILRQLSAAPGSVCACEFTDCCDVTQPTISHHLKVLREAGVVSTERRGTFIYYALSPDFAHRWAGIGARLSGLVEVA